MDWRWKGRIHKTSRGIADVRFGTVFIGKSRVHMAARTLPLGGLLPRPITNDDESTAHRAAGGPTNSPR